MAAKTYFCYGIPVTNESLTYATMAYPKLNGPFRFIRLAQQRLRNGTLQTAHNAAVGALPIEIWELVRHKVVDVELRAAERKFLYTHACEHCTPGFGCDCQDTRPAERWTELVHCEVCLNTLAQYESFEVPALAKSCRLLLHDYGLDLPSTRTLRSSQPGGWPPTNSDPDSVAFVVVLASLPMNQIDADDHVSCEHPEVDNRATSHNDGIWPVSLDKPADADQRFRHLLRDLHLTPRKVSDGTIGVARANWTLERTYEKISVDEVQPQWHLFTTVHCDWW